MTTGVSRREFLKLAAAGAAASGLAGCAGKRRPAVPTPVRRTLILGFDGLDPHLVTAWIKQGLLPNFDRLRRQGGLRPLRSSVPPQSPVAWANFITGMDPSGHGIYDFIHRDLRSYGPQLSTSSTSPAERTVRLGDWVVPLSKAQITLTRRGPAFWNVLQDHGVPATIHRIPSNFPPEPTTARTLSGLGTPDIQGSYGHFSYFTTHPPANADEVTGGTVYPVKVSNGTVVARLVGPANDFRASEDQAAVEFRVHIDEENPVARIDLQDRQIMLKEGEWSDWVRVKFKLVPGLASVSGICRFHLQSVRPLRLYVTPVNIDPSDPAMPISTPPDYARELDQHLDGFYTQGMAEDTKALSSGILSDEEFLDQARFLFEQQRDALYYELERFEDGVLFSYFSTSDLVVHMFWRAIDRRHPLWSEALAQAHGDVIKNVYRDLDGVLGHALETLDDEALVMVVSDHGFSPYRRSFDVNSWLIDNGYLRADPKADGVVLDEADWAHSKAYGMGFNGLYINEVGREVEGSVPPGPSKEKLLDELAAKLKAVRDPETGTPVVRAVYRTDEYADPDPQSPVAPDAILGFHLGYRGSWESAVGDAARTWIADNDDKWSGDHCMDADVVPGTWLCNRPTRAEQPALYDLAPTILSHYGIEPPDNMIGSPLLEAT